MSSIRKVLVSSKVVTSSNSKEPINIESIVNVENFEFRSSTPPFLLTFEIFNYNVHNYLIDSNASTKTMPLLICKKLNIEL